MGVAIIAGQGYTGDAAHVRPVVGTGQTVHMRSVLTALRSEIPFTGGSNITEIELYCTPVSHDVAVATPWQANFNYGPGQVLRNSTSSTLYTNENKYEYYKSIGDGLSGATEPDWPIVGTVGDNEIQWKHMQQDEMWNDVFGMLAVDALDDTEANNLLDGTTDYWTTPAGLHQPNTDVNWIHVPLNTALNLTFTTALQYGAFGGGRLDVRSSSAQHQLHWHIKGA